MGDYWGVWGIGLSEEGVNLGENDIPHHLSVLLWKYSLEKSSILLTKKPIHGKIHDVQSIDNHPNQKVYYVKQFRTFSNRKDTDTHE